MVCCATPSPLLVLIPYDPELLRPVMALPITTVISLVRPCLPGLASASSRRYRPPMFVGRGRGGSVSWNSILSIVVSLLLVICQKQISSDVCAGNQLV